MCPTRSSCSASWTAATVLLAVAALAALPPAVRAEEPDAAQVLDRYVEVTGGREAYEKLRTLKMQLLYKAPAAHLEGKMTTYQEAPNKFLNVLDLGALGKSEEGYDGQVAWEMSLMGGPRIREGLEKAFAARLARFNSDLHWRELYKEAKNLGIGQVNGEECYNIELTPHEGAPEHRYFSKATGLATRGTMHHPTPLGVIPVDSYVLEYKQVGDIKVPSRINQKAGPNEVVLELISYETNIELAARIFEPPDQVKKLLAKDAPAPKDGAADQPAGQ